MTVEQYFDQQGIDGEFISNTMVDGSAYWDNCERFVQENWGSDMDTLSEKQVSWLMRIVDDCREKAVR